MAYRFHAHGTSFQVLRDNGRTLDFARTGWKDTWLVGGTSELLMRFAHDAGERTPCMFHCHILEREDAGMMGQFTVA
jgi:FtsP/CotA-like multicopper oxidase with cupredoxin domain